MTRILAATDPLLLTEPSEAEIEIVATAAGDVSDAPWAEMTEDDQQLARRILRAALRAFIAGRRGA